MNSSISRAPSPPPNTPNSSRIEDELKEECERQENKLKEHLRSRNVLQIFAKSEYEPMTSAKVRKRPASTSTLTAIPKIEPYINAQMVSLIFLSCPLIDNSLTFTFQVSAKETSRRRRKKSSIEALCEIVPGLDDKTDDTKALEMTAKYILFLKTKVSPDHDKEFLRKQII